MPSSSPRIRVALALVLTAGAFTVATDAVTYAATGQSLILGKANKAGGTTVVTNTGRGPVLDLRGGRTFPPLKVNSRRKVANLNADTVDGLDSTRLEPRVIRYQLGSDGGELPSGQSFRRGAVPAGTYEVTLSGIVVSPAGADTGFCLAGDAERVLAGDNTGIFAYGDKPADALGVLHAGSVVTVPAGRDLLFGCTLDSGDGSPWQLPRAVTVTLRPVTVTGGASEPTVVPARASARMAGESR